MEVGWLDSHWETTHGTLLGMCNPPLTPRRSSFSYITAFAITIGWLMATGPHYSWGQVAQQPIRLDRWQRHVIDAAKPWRTLFIASEDMDGDGHRDVITGGWWYRNPGRAAGAWKRHPLGDPLYNMAAVFDCDRDGDFDVLGTSGKASESSSTFVWARNGGDGSFLVLENIEVAVGDFLQGVAVGEFEGPGKLAVALSWHQGGNGVQLLSVPEDPSLSPWRWERISETSQDEQLSAGHIEGQHSLDLLLGTKWLRNEGAKWSVHVLFEPPGDPDRNRLADLSGDGKLDAVVGYQAVNRPGKVAWYEQPASPSDIWTEHVVGTVVGPMSLDVGDLDRDGDLDIVVGEHNYEKPETAKLVIFENRDGQATSWKQHVIHTGDEHHDGTVLVDIDQDGDSDVVSIGWKEPEVWLYENKALDPS